MDTEDLVNVDVAPSSGDGEVGEREQRFFAQLGERDGPGVAGAVARLLDRWRGIGGAISYGRSETTSCSPVIEPGSRTAIWPVTFYPGSTVEVVFLQLKTRPPFDDPALRSELRRRLNQAPDIELPLAKLELRPSFPIAWLADPETWQVVADTLSWFAATVFEYREAQHSEPDESAA